MHRISQYARHRASNISVSWIHSRGETIVYLGVRWKLLGSLGLLVIFIFIVGLIGVGTSQSIKSNLDEVAQVSMPSVKALADVQLNLVRGQRDLRGATLADTDQEIAALITRADASFVAVEKAWAAYKALPASDAETLRKGR